MARSASVVVGALCAVLLFAACAEAEQPDRAPEDAGSWLAAGGRRSFATTGHSCAVVDGGIQCWGASDRGQTGDGSLARRRPLPVSVPGITGARAVAAGAAHTCVLAGERVLCFGDNAHGQGGSSRPLLQLVPSPVPDLPAHVTAIAAGADHSCAVVADRVWCWGRNESGESGRVPREDCRVPFRVRRCSVTPTRVDGITGPVAALALGEHHSCALMAGEVFCWGDNARGQLGAGSDAARAVAARVEGLPGPVSALASGRVHVCALVAGEAICWGGGDAVPATVSGLASGLDRLAAGGDRSCAAGSDGVWCWDANEAPGRIDGLTGPVRSLAVGLDHACVLQADAVRCWGENDSGQLGIGVLPRSRIGASRVAPWDRGQLRDVDRDGRITVVCLGDSNTQAMAGAASPWCDQLAPLLPAGFRVVNRGLGGATATAAASLLDASAPLTHALENDAPDVALLAFGTNDVLAKIATREIVTAIARHARRLQAEGVIPFIALVPPLRSDDTAANRAVLELNAGLRQAFPAERILDFFSGFDDEALVDRVHQGAAAQARRARIAAELLSGFPAESLP